MARAHAARRPSTDRPVPPSHEPGDPPAIRGGDLRGGGRNRCGALKGSSPPRTPTGGYGSPMSELTPGQAKDLRHSLEQARAALDTISLVMADAGRQQIQDLLDSAAVAVDEARHVVVEVRAAGHG
jgi:hypothetical protein